MINALTFVLGGLCFSTILVLACLVAYYRSKYEAEQLVNIKHKADADLCRGQLSSAYQVFSEALKRPAVALVTEEQVRQVADRVSALVFPQSTKPN